MWASVKSCRQSAFNLQYRHFSEQFQALSIGSRVSCKNYGVSFGFFMIWPVIHIKAQIYGVKDFFLSKTTNQSEDLSNMGCKHLLVDINNLSCRFRVVTDRKYALKYNVQPLHSETGWAVSALSIVQMLFAWLFLFA